MEEKDAICFCIENGEPTYFFYNFSIVPKNELKFMWRIKDIEECFKYNGGKVIVPRNSVWSDHIEHLKNQGGGDYYKLLSFVYDLTYDDCMEFIKNNK